MTSTPRCPEWLRPGMWVRNRLSPFMGRAFVLFVDQHDYKGGFSYHLEKPYKIHVTDEGWRTGGTAFATGMDGWEPAEEVVSETGDSARLDWLETLPCGITINADRDHQAKLMTRQQPGYLRDFIDAVRKERSGPDFNQEVNLHADQIAERHDGQFDIHCPVEKEKP